MDFYVDFRKGEPVFLDTRTPEFSWSFPEKRGVGQRAYRIKAEDERGGVLWDSGRVSAPAERSAVWGGSPLPPRTRVTAVLEVWFDDGAEPECSSPVHFETTLLDNADWGEARWIWYDRNNYSTTAPSPYFRREFAVRTGLRRARLHVGARGCADAWLDGGRIGRDYFAPGWTDYRLQIPFVTFDLTASLTPGKHVLGAVLADGWCCGNLTIFRFRNFYHAHPELIAELDLEYEDGSRESVVTDASWKCATGPILAADFYDGETYDARQEIPGWCAAGFDDSSWIAAAEGDAAAKSPRLVQRSAPPVRCTEEIKPVRMLRPDKDVCIWDFGRNFTGVFRVALRGLVGRIYTFQTAEMLKDSGYLYCLNYRGARSRDHYICKGSLESSEEYTPSFTFHGFRYLQIDGWQFDHIPPESLEVTGLVLRSDMPDTAEFTCGSEMLNQLWKNALCGQHGNFLEIPTDCPQRDERLGWTGDAEIFAPTAMYNADCRTFFRKYLRDVRDAMTPEGAAPSIAPAVLKMNEGAAAWGDAVVLIPYMLYRHYGWTGILAENYEAMKSSVLWQLAHQEDGLAPLRQFGDWLAPQPTPKQLVAAAYFAHCAGCVREAAAVLGKKEDEARFAGIAGSAAENFRRHFTDADGVVSPRTQTALALGIVFDLILPGSLSANAAALDAAIRENGTRLNTGFVGTAMLMTALDKCGLLSTACDLLLQEEYPSWLYSVKQGATTCWEHWNSYSAEDGFADVAMNSFNHYAFGAVVKFMLNRIGGISCAAGKVTLNIIPDRRFSPVHAAYDSPHGRIVSDWAIAPDGNLHWQVTVPGGVCAEAVLPDGSVRPLPAGETTVLS